MRIAFVTALIAGLASLVLAETARGVQQRVQPGIGSGEPVGGVTEPARVESRSLMPAGVFIEGESMVTPEEEAATVQPMQGFGDRWSGAAQLLWVPKGPFGALTGKTAPIGKQLWLSFELEAGGFDGIALAHTVAPDYGKVRVAILAEKWLPHETLNPEGYAMQVGELDGFAPQVGLSRRYFGPVSLEAGRHWLILEVLEKNPASSGYLFGLDRLELLRGKLPFSTLDQPSKLVEPTSKQAPTLEQTRSAGEPEVVTFQEPATDGYRVDYCFFWGERCGQPAATAFCVEKGYAGALDWELAEDIGQQAPTRTLGDKRVCDQPGCDGFFKITCSK